MIRAGEVAIVDRTVLLPPLRKLNEAILLRYIRDRTDDWVAYCGRSQLVTSQYCLNTIEVFAQWQIED